MATAPFSSSSQSSSFSEQGPAFPENEASARAALGGMTGATGSINTAMQGQLARLQTYMDQLNLAKLLSRMMAAGQGAKAGGMANPAAQSRAIIDLMNNAGIPFDTQIQQVLQNSNNIENTANQLTLAVADSYKNLASIQKGSSRSQSTSQSGTGIGGGSARSSGMGTGANYDDGGYTNIRGGAGRGDTANPASSPFAGNATTFGQYASSAGYGSGGEISPENISALQDIANINRATNVNPSDWEAYNQFMGVPSLAGPGGMQEQPGFNAPYEFTPSLAGPGGMTGFNETETAFLNNLNVDLNDIAGVAYQPEFSGGTTIAPEAGVTYSVNWPTSNENQYQFAGW